MKVKDSTKSPLDALEFRIHKMHNINTQAMDIQRPKEFKVEVKLISSYLVANWITTSLFLNNCLNSGPNAPHKMLSVQMLPKTKCSPVQMLPGPNSPQSKCSHKMLPGPNCSPKFYEVNRMTNVHVSTKSTVGISEHRSGWVRPHWPRLLWPRPLWLRPLWPQP